MSDFFFITRLRSSSSCLLCYLIILHLIKTFTLQIIWEILQIKVIIQHREISVCIRYIPQFVQQMAQEPSTWRRKSAEWKQPKTVAFEYFQKHDFAEVQLRLKINTVGRDVFRREAQSAQSNGESPGCHIFIFVYTHKKKIKKNNCQMQSTYFSTKIMSTFLR